MFWLHFCGAVLSSIFDTVNKGPLFWQGVISLVATAAYVTAFVFICSVVVVLYLITVTV